MTNIQKWEAAQIALPDPAQWEIIKQMAATAVQAGFNRSIDNVAKGITVLLVARESGIPMMFALQRAHVINGRVDFPTEMYLGLAYQRVPGFTYEVVEVTPEHATIRMSRDGQGTLTTMFTMDQAKRAGLAGRDVWKAWGEDMLLWSATRKGLRRLGAGMLLSLPIADDEDEAVTPAPAPPRSEATVIAEGEKEMASALKPATEKVVVTPDPPAVLSALEQQKERFKVVAETTGRIKQGGRGWTGSWGGLANALIDEYKLDVRKVKSITDVVSDEWPALADAADHYFGTWKARREAGPQAVAVEATPASATEGAPAPVEVEQEASDGPPAATRFAAKGDGVEPGQRSAADVIALAQRAEKAFAHAGEPRQFLSEYKGGQYLMDLDILESIGFTDGSGKLVDGFAPHHLNAAWTEITKVKDACEARDRRPR